MARSWAPHRRLSFCRRARFGTPRVTAAPAIVAHLSPAQLFDSLVISVDGPRAWDLDLSLDVTLTDIGTNHRLTLRDGVLIYSERPADDTANVTLTLTKDRMLGLLAGDTSSWHRDGRGRVGPGVPARRTREGRSVVRHRDGHRRYWRRPHWTGTESGVAQRL